jgi:lipopolysaccharide transport system permease protein
MNSTLVSLRHLWAHRDLIWQFARRQLQEDYRGSYLGFLWSILTPLAMLAVYTFVFSTIFQARWAGIELGSRFDYALFLFAGLIPYNLFSDVALKSTRLITGRPNFVKRVIFPLEILPVSLLLASLAQALINMLILLAGVLLAYRQLHATLLLAPLIFLPLLLFSLGVSWFLASLGVFLRDLDHFLRILLQILFFLTPIIYPLSALPENLQLVLRLNPLTHIVIPFQDTVLLAEAPGWSQLALLMAGSVLVCLLGFAWFMRSKKTFADVV